MAADITAISVKIRNDISDWLIALDCDCCDDPNFLQFAFNNDIDTVLNYSFITDEFTNEQILSLAAFANAANADTPVFSGNASVAGSYPLVVYAAQSFVSTGTVQPLLTADVNECIRNKISDFLFSSDCCCTCDEESLKEILFYNDVETVLNYEIAEDAFTSEEINGLIAFVGCLGCPTASTNSGSIAGPYVPKSKSVKWGEITGTLSDQTDLQAALDDIEALALAGL